jgi:voltage-gated potassium channel
MEFSLSFIHILFVGFYFAAPILLLLFTIIIALGLLVGRIETWTKFNAVYWAFITALTVGYGDLKPMNNTSRVLSILIAAIGIMLAGILVAITVEAASRAFEKHYQAAVVEDILGK